jgi:hypothetical protein
LPQVVQTAPALPHALFAVPLTQTSFWQQPPAQFVALHAERHCPD